MSKEPGQYTGGTMPMRRPARTQETSEATWRQPRIRPPQPSRPAKASPTTSKPRRSGSKLWMIFLLLPVLVIGGIAYIEGGPRMREPRTGMAPFVELGQQAEFVNHDEGGLVAVTEYRWLADRPTRLPGDQVLAVHLTFEVIRGNPSVPETTRVITQDGFRFFTSEHPDDELPALRPTHLVRGFKAAGWVFFELPKQDVTFVYATEREESLRLAIEGGPAPSVPEFIAVNGVLDVEPEPHCPTTVVGAVWTRVPARDNLMHVGLLIRRQAWRGDCGFTMLQLTDVMGNRIPETFEPIPPYRPAFWPYEELRQGDTQLGWLFYQTEQRPLWFGYYGEPTVRIPVG